jgi:Protein kinase domain
MMLRNGDRLGAYEVLSEIGAGGMGVVYRARDVRLGRVVAIKLSAGAGSVDDERRRLLREAQHASALNHPNICTIYEVDESDGHLFIVEEDPTTEAALKQAYVTSGLPGYWRKELELAVPHFQKEVEIAREQPSRRYVSGRWLAELYARLGDKERAFTLLQDAFDNRDENLRFLKVETLRIDSPWQILVPDPRYAQLIRGMGLEE